MAILIRAIVVTLLGLPAGVSSASAQYPDWSAQVVWQVGSADNANYASARDQFELPRLIKARIVK